MTAADATPPSAGRHLWSSKPPPSAGRWLLRPLSRNRVMITLSVKAGQPQYVVYPVHLDGTPIGAKPRRRHDPDCSHFEWEDGTVLGTLQLKDLQWRGLLVWSPGARRAVGIGLFGGLLSLRVARVRV